jgi:hypothetical protein
VNIQTITIELWYKSESLNNNERFVSKEYNGIGSWFIEKNNLGHLQFGFYDGNDWYSLVYPDYVEDNSWHYLSIVFDNGLVNMNLDSVLVASFSFLGTQIQYNNQVSIVIGANSNLESPSLFFKGKVSNFRIYDVSLSSSDISINYEQRILPNEWILSTGFWNDRSIWIDTEKWKD